MDFLDSYFTPEWTIDNFLETVESMTELNIPPNEESKSQSTTPKASKSPRRKTFGALINELREEIRDLKLEIELRDAYIYAMINDLKNKK